MIVRQTFLAPAPTPPRKRDARGRFCRTFFLACDHRPGMGVTAMTGAIVLWCLVVLHAGLQL